MDRWMDALASLDVVISIPNNTPTPTHTYTCSHSHPHAYTPACHHHRSAWAGLRHRTGNMSLLVVLGTSAAFLYSIISIVLAAVRTDYNGHVFFESSMLIITDTLCCESRTLIACIRVCRQDSGVVMARREAVWGKGK
eukprot:364020-Chlamydomonas_euryale.AAC.9